MKASEILFIGIGQGGNNLISDLYQSNPRINTFYINTTEDDVKGMDVKHKHIFTGGQGTAKDRDVAKEYANGEIRAVADKTNAFKDIKYVFLAFTMGGGTGSGIGPDLADMLLSIRSDLKVILVPMTSFSHESVKTHMNVLACWNEIIELEDVGIMLIDNNKRSTKSEINNEFVRLFNLMLNMNAEYHKDGVIDLSEIGLMAGSDGMMGIYDLSEYGKKDIATIMKESIFGGVGIDCEYLGMTLPDGVNRAKILDIFNYRLDSFQGYSKNNPLLVLSGSNINSKPIQKIQQAAQDKIDVYNAKTIEQDNNIAVGGLSGLDSFINSKPKKQTKNIEDVINDKEKKAKKEEAPKRKSKKAWETLVN